MSRGDQPDDVFLGEGDKYGFLSPGSFSGLTPQTCSKTAWLVHAFCLMQNHFHLVVETPQANLVAGMKWLPGEYTRRFNRRHKLFGHLFSGRYKALVVDGSGNGYLKSVCDYVHLNPVRAHLLGPEAPLDSYRWSSYPLYLQEPSRRPAWLRVDRCLGEWGIPKDSVAGRRQLAAQLEARRQGESEEEFKPLRRGWCLGSEEFRDELLAQVSEKRGLWHYGAELQESAEAKAERLIRGELKRRHLTEHHLAARPKGDQFKVALASKLRKETTVTVSWIARRLNMGTRGNVTHLLYWQGKTSPEDNQASLGL